MKRATGRSAISGAPSGSRPSAPGSRATAQTLEEHGLPLNPEWTVTVGTKTESAYVDMLAWLEQGHPLPTAFFADNDLMAFGVTGP